VSFPGLEPPFLGLPITNLLNEEDALTAIRAGFVYVPDVPFFVNKHLPFEFVLKPHLGPPLRLLAPSYVDGLEIVAPEPIVVFKPGVYARNWTTIKILIEKLNRRNGH